MQATNLSNEFAKRGYSVDILVTKDLTDQSFFDTDKNLQIVSLKEYNANQSLQKHPEDIKKREQRIKKLKRFQHMTRSFSGINRRLSDKIKLLRNGAELRDYFLNTRPDIVIPFGISFVVPAVSATEGIDCKIVYAEKNAPELEFPEKSTDQFEYYVRLLNRLHATIVQTENAKQFFDGRVDNICVINNPIKKDLPLPYCGERKKTIVNFCRMSPQKNLDLLIDAFAKLCADYPAYKLCIYGNTVHPSEIEYKDRIIQKVNALGLQKQIEVLPPIADVHQKVRDSAMFVSSSDFEGLSNSMIEAMAIGLPCVCTDCLGGGAREVIIDEENGLIVPMNDADAMYHAMKRLIEDPGLAEQCGQNASKIREKLDVKKIAQKWIDIFQE